jgi:hypothetical protein
MSCEHDCAKPATFPATLFNRPGLAHINYRIGSYTELRARMLELLNQDAVLAGWTHRGADDPGIALIEGAAIVGDILTFYQQLYANEQYLRSAQWRDSIAELVRLLGYRLAPGLGGEATFALAVKGSEPVTVPQGFGLKAQLEAQPKPVEFESSALCTAYPGLNTFALYQPFTYPSITSGSTTTFSVPKALLDSVAGGLRPGDRLMLVVASTDSLTYRQIAVVAAVQERFERSEISIEGNWRGPTTASGIWAYKLGRSFRYFGYNAPAKETVLSGGVATQNNVSYSAQVGLPPNMVMGYLYGVYYPLPSISAYPLDQKLDNLAVGSVLLATLQLSNTTAGVGQTHFFERQITSVTSATLTLGALTGGASVVELNATLARPDLTPALIYTDIRSVDFHEVIGAKFQLQAARAPQAGADNSHLYYYGDAATYQQLSGRALLLTRDDQVEPVQVTIDTSTLGSDNEVSLRPLTLSTPLQVFSIQDFPLDNPTVVVYGNLLTATQGKTQAEVVLGSGDRRQTFQTFALPASPLTYLLDETQSPAQVPALQLYVDGIEWQRVDAFFNSGPDDPVYIVRIGEDNQGYVQFGDGKTGRRLPSGLNNVTVVFRVGLGAHGALKPGSHPQITGKLNQFDKLYLPVPVGVGAGPEDGANARRAAPGKMQSLGRMVSLADIEAEALAIPHVIKTRAVWTAPENVPLVRLTVLTESGAATDISAVRASLQTFNRCRGPARYPIDVIQGIRQFIALHIEAGFDAARRASAVTAAIKTALGLAGEEGNGIDGANGLFGVNTRQFGQGAHPSQIIAAVQNATGVTWVKLKAAQTIDLGLPPETDPTALATPAVEVVSATLDCPEVRLLALHSTHFTLSLTKDEVARECAP